MTIYTQYTNSPRIQAILAGIAPHLKISISDFYRDYFDIDTANSQWLDNWGRILGLSRNLTIDTSYDHIVGFDTGDGNISPIEYPQNFNQGAFYSAVPTSLVSLTDTVYRVYLKFRYHSLTTNASIEACNVIINTYASSINPVHRARVVDMGDMFFKYEFNYLLEPYERTLFLIRGILPMPMGVGYDLIDGLKF